MEYVEEREFLLRLEVRCPFPPDYDGDEDGYAWVESFRPIAAQIVQAAAADAPPPAEGNPPEPPEVRAAAYVDALLKAFAGTALLIR